jgi:hypothetical protein
MQKASRAHSFDRGKPGSPRWPIERMWTVVCGKTRLDQVRTRELHGYRACGILGAAGLGKTYELRYLADLDRWNSLDVRIERLAELAQTPDGLASALSILAGAASEKSIIYLDALDEVMIPVRVAGLIIQRWIRNELAARRPVLRISCRSAVWPNDIQDALCEVYGEESCAVAMLQPLPEEDVKHVACARGLDAGSFMRAVIGAGVQALSQQPLTLEMLLLIYDRRKELPSNRSELFARGVEELASERIERLEAGTATEFTVPEILEAAERLACFALLSGRETIDRSDSPSPASLGRIELVSLPGGSRNLDDELIRAVGRCGLCDSDGPRQFRFGHRQFAEYLAGRRLTKLLPHQSRALLSSALGWEAGVAGPLRETAAFAAIECDTVANWLAERDPEVIGLSDVVDDDIRRRGTLNLLEKFRKQELTDSQFFWGDRIELKGFQYAGAEADLRPVLQERSGNFDDVLECAIKLIENWELRSMSNDLADFVLDDAAPLEARRSAGYALRRMGTVEARRRLRPLIYDHQSDPDFDLKGLALSCNWPDGLTLTELLAGIIPRRSNRHGAYEGFLFDLDRSGFDAATNRLEGLVWALQFMYPHSDIESAGRIARRIAIASIDELDEPGIAEALVDVILAAAKNHAESPLIPPRRFTSEEDESQQQPPVLKGNTKARRRLLDALSSRSTGGSIIWWITHQTPALLILEDFPWLLERATNASIPMPQRKRYAELALMLPWVESSENVDAWLSVRTVEPVASCFPLPLSIDLDSQEAAKARKAYKEAKAWSVARPPKKLCPEPKERVKQVLTLSETKDARFFANLSNELTLKDDSTHYGFSRFLSTTPGWKAADAETRRRIVEAAKRFLATDSDEPERCQSKPLNNIFPDHMAAMWLVMEHDLSWLEARPAEWWQRWTWYILRELRPGLSDGHDQQALIISLLELLHHRAAGKVRATVEKLVTSATSEEKMLLSSLLDALRSIDDTELDTLLCDRLIVGKIPDHLISDVALFVLSRSSGDALSACLKCLEPESVSKAEERSVRAAVALLQEQTLACWGNVHEFLRRRPDLAPRVLGEFAHGEQFGAPSKKTLGLGDLNFEQIGQLVALLLQTFPPDLDLRHDGASNTGSDDSTKRLRDRLISWLGGQRDIRAVETLRLLEQQFGEKYPWLRHPRAQAERAYRQSRWLPIPPRAVAEVLASADKRLIRSGQDAVEGVEAAIKYYADRLHQESQNDIEDLWNLPKRGNPSPKEEERVSVKICAAIRDYFRQYAVTADREVQIFRRKFRRHLDGSPGSEVDVLCSIPAKGAMSTDPITLPIEVKLSHNPEARSALRDQLVNRYMSQLGTSYGVFVLAWMGRPIRGSTYRPLWTSLSTAQQDLLSQASEAQTNDGFCIRAIVIDASLSTFKKPRKLFRKAPSPRRATTRKRSAAKKQTGRKKTRSKTRPSRQKKKRTKPRRSSK